MNHVSAGHIILTPTQSVRSGWPQRGSNPESPHQESRALQTELKGRKSKRNKGRKESNEYKRSYNEIDHYTHEREKRGSKKKGKEAIVIQEIEIGKKIATDSNEK